MRLAVWRLAVKIIKVVIVKICLYQTVIKYEILFQVSVRVYAFVHVLMWQRSIWSRMPFLGKFIGESNKEPLIWKTHTPPIEPRPLPWQKIWNYKGCPYLPNKRTTTGNTRPFYNIVKTHYTIHGRISVGWAYISLIPLGLP